MPFSFTFKLSVPGLANPFSPAKAPYSSTSPPRVSDSLIDRGYISPRRFASSVSKPPTPLSGLPISRKRGWEPTFAEPTRSTTSLTRGYLDTPYPQMALDEYQEAIASDTEMPPPAKRRRGLAGSIVDTALNAALIGTAVGLTMYRLWRDRGKGPERLPPPPPYQQGEWTPDHDKHQHQRQAASLQSQLPPPPPPSHVTPATSRNFRKGRHPAGVSSSVGKRTTHRRTVRRGVVSHPHHHSQTQHHQSYPSTSSASSSSTSAPPLFPPPQPEFDFEPEPVADDQMDWIGDKLSMLIQQGKQALSREVVVMSDAQEDEVDDGSGAWEEEDEPRPDHHHHHHHRHHHRHNSDNDAASIRTSVSVSSSSSVKRARRPRSLTPAAPHFPQQQLQLQTPSPSPHKAGFECSPALALAMTPAAATSAAGYREETGGAWESPEIRESMEKARAKVLGMRMRGAGS